MLSVALHAGLGGVFAHYGTFGVVPGLTDAPRPPPPSEPLLVLGIDESKATTDTWLGFEEATEHSGPLSPIEQAALSPQPGQAPLPEPSPTNTPAPPREPDRAAEPAETRSATHASDSPASEAALNPGPTKEPQEESQSQESTTAPTTSKQADPTDRVGPPRPPPSTVIAPASPAVKAPGESAETSEREATAAALKEAVDVKPGHPVAAKGLNITTVRPRWSITTQIVASPRNPVVKVTFGRTGRVIRAEFVRGQNTGWPQVDDPLLDAIYRWRAKGDAIAKLPSHPPDAGVPIIFRITLRGESLP